MTNRQQESDATYRVERYYRDTWFEPRKVVKRGLTLEEAQAHCKREDTRGEGWFDGYVQEG